MLNSSFKSEGDFVVLARDNVICSPHHYPSLPCSWLGDLRLVLGNGCGWKTYKPVAGLALDSIPCSLLIHFFPACVGGQVVQVAKLQDKRGLSDSSPICEEYTLLYEATDIWGGINQNSVQKQTAPYCSNEEMLMKEILSEVWTG